MNWKKHIEDAYRSSERFKDYGTLPVFSDPADIRELKIIEEFLECSLPKELIELFIETDGVKEKMLLKGRYVLTGTLIDSCQKMLEMNKWYRENEKDIKPKQNFQQYVFFGQTGVDGIYFAFKNSENRTEQKQIYAWYPINVEFLQIATNLEDLTFNWATERLIF